MRRPGGSRGSAIVFALIAVAIVTGLGIYTATRVSQSEQRSVSSGRTSAADSAADAGLAAAIARIQRVGSGADASAESGSSTLDVSQTANINGINTTDGTYTATIRSGQAGCNADRQRLLTVTAQFREEVRKRYLCFWIVPRVWRFGAYADGSGSTASNSYANSSLEVGNGFHLLMPPPYKALEGSTGSDLGVNGSASFGVSAWVNSRDANSGDFALYDSLFIPQGVTPSTNRSYRYGSSSDKQGTDWGTFYRAPAPNTGGSKPVVQWGNGTQITNFPASLGSPNATGNVNFSGPPITLATRTQAPEYSQLSQWKTKAASQGQSSILGGSPDTISATLNKTGSQGLRGIVYVECTDGGTFRIKNGLQLTISSGSLILNGCNLEIQQGGSLKILRDTTNPYASMQYPAGSTDTASCDVTTPAELTAPPGGCIWAYPALAVMKDGSEQGGNLQSSANGNDYVQIQGNVMVDGNFTLNTTSLPGNTTMANWNSLGALYVDGKMTLNGAGGAVMRWHPLAQRMYFDAATGRMGTYSIRTEDRALSTKAPTIGEWLEKPANPTDQTTATFKWTINNSFDTVTCTLTANGSTKEVPCANTNATLSGLEKSTSYTFTVKACVLGADSQGNQKQLCSDSDLAKSSYTWFISGPEPVITLKDKPASTTNSTSAAFTWSLENSSTVKCKLDPADPNGSDSDWPSCDTSESQAYSGLSTGSHKLVVSATNGSGNTRISYTWTVTDTPSPQIQISPLASDNLSYTTTSVTFQWSIPNSDQSNPTSSTCQMDDGQLVQGCSSPYTATGLSTGDHTFVLTVCGDAGCSSKSYDFTINPPPPTQPTWLSTPGDPQTYDSGSSSSAQPALFNWSSDRAADYQCKLDGGDWFDCKTTTQPPIQIEVESCQEHTFRVKAVNISGETDVTTYTWNVACPPPGAPTISNKPEAESYDHTPTFSFAATTYSPTSFQCKMDDGNWGTCTSPKNYSTLSDGEHTFQVRGCNASGCGSSASYTWTVLALPKPVVTIKTSPAASVPYTETEATFTWEVDGLDLTDIACKMDDGSWESCKDKNPSNQNQYIKTYPDLQPNSEHHFYVRACNGSSIQDNCGTDDYKWTILPPKPEISWDPDGGKPSVQQTYAPAPEWDFKWIVDPTTPATSTECSLDGGTFTPCESPAKQTYEPCMDHNFKVRVANAGGYSQLSYDWYVKCAPPTVQINNTKPSDPTKSKTATIGWDVIGSKIASTECKLERLDTDPDQTLFDWQDCQAQDPSSGNKIYNDLNRPGMYRFSVRVTNESNPDAPASDSYTWHIGPTKPTVSFSGDTPAQDSSTRDTTPTFDWQSQGEAELEPVCSITTSGVTTPVNCSGSSYTPGSGLAAGSHTFNVKVRYTSALADDYFDPSSDRESETISRTVTVLAPSVTITSGPSGEIPPNQTSKQFSFSVDGSPLINSTPTCLLQDSADGVSWNTVQSTACTAPDSPVYSGLVPGKYYKFTVTVQTSAGTDSATQTFHMLSNPPTVTISAPEEGTQTRNTTPTFSWTPSSDYATVPTCQIIDPANNTSNVPCSDTSYTPSTGLAAGVHTFRVRLTDIYDQQSSWASVSITILAPAATVTSGPTGVQAHTETSAQFGFTIDGQPLINSTPTCSLQQSDNGSSGWATATATATGSCAAGSSPSYSGLVPGKYYRFAVTATTSAGSTTSEYRTFNLKPTPPTVQINPALSGVKKLRNQPISWDQTSTDTLTPTCTLDNQTVSCSGTSYTTSNLQDGEHTFKIRVTDSFGQYAEDSNTWTIDATAPTVSSFTTATSSPSNTTSLSYTLVFSESVSGLTAGDLSVAGNATGWSIQSVSGSGTTYTVNLSSSSPTDGTVYPVLAAESIQDAASNLGPAATENGTSIQIDRTAPTVSSFTTATSSPSNTTSLSYTLVFSESVSGLTAGDLSVAGNATGWSIQSVSGSGATYTVNLTASSPTDGTVYPVLAAESIQDAASNLGPAATENGTSIQIDRTAPSVSSFATATTSPSNATSLSYTLVFSESVSGLTVGDLSVAGNSTGWSIGSVTGSGTTYTVNLSSSSPTDGTVYPVLGINTVSDQATNTGPATPASGTSIQIDRTAPTVSSFTTATSSPSNTTSLSYTLVFSESVSGLTAGDLSVAGNSTGWSIGSVTGSGTTYTVNLSSSSPTDGTVYPVLAASSVQDIVSNLGPATPASGTSIQIDRTAPTVSSFTTATSSPSNTTSLSYTLVFSESVSGLTAGDLSVAGNATGWSIQSVSGSGTTYTVNLSSSSPTDGTVYPVLGINTVSDQATNTGPATPASGTSIQIDRTAPTATWTLPSGLSAGSSTSSSSLVYTLTFLEAITELVGTDDITNAGNATGCLFTPSASSGTTITVTVTGCSDGSLAPRLRAGTSSPIGVLDAAGNRGPVVDTDASAITLDRSPPAAPSLTRTPQGNSGTTGTLTNLIKNPSLETSGSGWGAYTSNGANSCSTNTTGTASCTNATGSSVSGTAVTTAQADSGSQSFKADFTAAANSTWWQMFYGSSAYTIPGGTTQIYIQARVRWTSSNLTGPLPLRVGGRFSSGCTSCYPGASYVNVTKDQWTTLSALITVSSGATKFDGLDVATGNNTSGQSITLYIDSAVAVAAPPGGIAPYFDGSWGGGTWTGTAHASTSTLSYSNYVAQNSVSQAFSGEAGASFGCIQEGVGPASCTSPVSMTSLADGVHSFGVRQTDGAGNSSTYTNQAWIVDTTAPSAPTITSQPSNPSNSSSASFSFTGESNAAFTCAIDGGAYSSCTSAKSYTGLSDASHTFQVKQTDQAGNASAASTVTWTVDTQAPPTPSVTLTSPTSSPASQNSATVSFTDTEAGVSFLCSIDGGAYSSCTSPKNYTGLSDGSHSVSVKAQDAAVNQSAAGTVSWVQDTTAPGTPSLSGAPTGSTTTTNQTITWAAVSDGTGSGIARYECSVDGAAYATCTSPQSRTGLTAGARSLAVRAVDNAGNTGSAATASWTVIAPTASVTSGPSGAVADTATSQNFGYTLSPTAANGLLSNACTLDQLATSGSTTMTNVMTNPSAEGTNVVEFNAYTNVGASAINFSGTGAQTVAGVGTATTTRNTSDAYAGSASQQTAFTNLGAANQYLSIYNAVPTASRSAVSGGQSVFVRLAIKMTSASISSYSGFRLQLVTTDASNTWLYATVVANGAQTVQMGQWTVFEATVTAPANSTKVLGWTLATSGGTGIPAGGSATIQADAAQIVVAPPSYSSPYTLPYWDGSTKDASWTGTANASTSTLAVPSAATWGSGPSAGSCSSSAAAYAGLTADTWYRFSASATSSAGSTTSAYRQFNLRSAAPTVTITSPTNGSSASDPTVTWTATGNAPTPKCTLDGAAVECTTPTSWYPSNGIATGSHTFSVQVVDRYGQTSSASTITWTVTTPTITFNGGPGDGASVANSGQRFTWSSAAVGTDNTPLCTLQESATNSAYGSLSSVTNMVLNPVLGTGSTANWSTGGPSGTSISYSSDGPFVGAGSLLDTMGAASTSYAYANPSFAISPIASSMIGKTLTGSIWVKLSKSGYYTVNLGTSPSTALIAETGSYGTRRYIAANTWTKVIFPPFQITESFVGTSQMSVLVSSYSAASGGSNVNWTQGDTIQFSMAQLVEGTRSYPDFYGGYGGGSWTGTAHASTSTLTATGDTTTGWMMAYGRQTDVSMARGGALPISSISGNGTAITVTTSSAHGLAVGNSINIVGVTGATAYNRNYATVASVPSSTTFTITATTTGAATTSGAYVTQATGSWPISASGSCSGTGSHTYTGWTAGKYYRFTVTYNTTSGPISAVRQFRIYPVAPTLSAITLSSPTVANGGTTNSTTQTASWTATSTDALTATCTLDGSPVSCTTSGASLSGLSAGSHTLSVTVTDQSSQTASSSISWTVDTTPPSATWSLPAGLSPGDKTTSNSLVYTLTFSEAVSGILASDFANAGNASNCSFTPSAASGTSITVTVAGCTDGTIAPRLTTGSVQDGANNNGPSSNADASSITKDTVAPTASWAATPSSPNNNSTVVGLSYTLTFSEAVTGFTAADLSNAASSGAATNCSFAVGSPTGNAYPITVTGCSEGNVVARLALGSISDGVNSGPTSNTDAANVLIDRTAPTATWTAAPSSPNNNSAVVGLSYTLTFSEAVTGFAAGDLSNAASSAAATSCSFAVGSPTGNAYPITVTGCSEGNVVARLALGSISDGVNSGPASNTDAANVLIDRTAPTATLTPPAQTTTNATSLTYTLDFSESISGLASGDFTVGGTATGWSVQSVTGSGAGTYTIVLGGGATSAGPVSLALNASSVADAAGNSGPAAQTPTSPTVITIDRTAPTATWTATPSSPNNNSAVVGLSYTLTFSETVTGFADADLSNAASSGAATSCSFAVGSPAGNAYPVTVTGCSEGNVIARLALGGVTDSAGNTGPASNTDAANVLIDRTVPGSFSLTRGDLVGANVRASNLSSVYYSFSASESVQASSLAVTSTSTTTATGCTWEVRDSSGSSIATPTTTYASAYRIYVSGCSAPTAAGNLVQPEITQANARLIADQAGNTNSTAGAVSTTSFTYDTTLPSPGSFTRTDLVGSYVRASTLASVSYTLTMSETVATAGITTASFANAGTATSCTFTPTAVSPSGGYASVYTVAVSGCANTSSATVQPQLLANQGTDQAGNASTSAAFTTSAAAFTYDTTDPAAPTITAPINNSYVSSTSQNVTWTGEANATFTCSVDGGAYSSCTSPTALNSLSQGAHSVSVKATDQAGNVSTAATVNWTVDTTAPTLSSITTSASQITGGANSWVLGTPTNATSVTYTLNFSEQVSGSAATLTAAALSPGASDTVAPAWAAGTAIATSSGASTSTAGSITYSDQWDITIGSSAIGTANGTLSPKLLASTAYDKAGNVAATSEAAAGGRVILDHVNTSSYSLARGDTTGSYVTAANLSGVYYNFDASESMKASSISVTNTSATSANGCSWTLKDSSGGAIASPTTTYASSYRVYVAGCNAAAAATVQPEITQANARLIADQAGNTNSTASAVSTTSFTYDTAGPTATLGRGDVLGSYISAANLSGVYYLVNIDESVKASTISVTSTSATSANGCSWTLKDSSGGAITSPTTTYASSYRVYVSGCTASAGATVQPEITQANARLITDQAGNTNSAAGAVSTTSFTYDTALPSAPTVTRTSPTANPTNSTSQTITYSGEASATFQCSSDNTAYSPCAASPISLSGLAAGTQNYYIKQTDQAGNQSSAGSVTWTIDTTAPSAPTALTRTSPASSPTTQTTATFTFTTGELGGTTECRLDSGSWTTTNCSVTGTSGTYTLSGISATGDHTVSVRQTDAAGNISSVTTSATWVVTPVTPTISWSSAPTASVSYSSSSSTTPGTVSVASGAADGFQCMDANLTSWTTCTGSTATAIGATFQNNFTIPGTACAADNPVKTDQTVQIRAYNTYVSGGVTQYQYSAGVSASVHRNCPSTLASISMNYPAAPVTTIGNIYTSSNTAAAPTPSYVKPQFSWLLWTTKPGVGYGYGGYITSLYNCARLDNSDSYGATAAVSCGDSTNTVAMPAGMTATDSGSTAYVAGSSSTSNTSGSGMAGVSVSAGKCYKARITYTNWDGSQGNNTATASNPYCYSTLGTALASASALEQSAGTPITGYGAGNAKATTFGSGADTSPNSDGWALGGCVTDAGATTACSTTYGAANTTTCVGNAFGARAAGPGGLAISNNFGKSTLGSLKITMGSCGAGFYGTALSGYSASLSAQGVYNWGDDVTFWAKLVGTLDTAKFALTSLRPDGWTSGISNNRGLLGLTTGSASPAQQTYGSGTNQIDATTGGGGTNRWRQCTAYNGGSAGDGNDIFLMVLARLANSASASSPAGVYIDDISSTGAASGTSQSSNACSGSFVSVGAGGAAG